MALTSPVSPVILGTEQVALLEELSQVKSGQFIFVTGRAGTGKSTLLRRFVSDSPLNIVVLAPTGLAAVQVGGQTIHSFFHLPFGPLTNSSDVIPTFRPGHPRARLIKNLNVLVIDEVSMVRADVLDAIDFSLRRNTGVDRPFGGKSVVAFGDIHQLEPVVQDGADRLMITDRYKSPFFFDAEVLRESGIDVWQLEHIYRQADQEFLWALEQVRIGLPQDLGYFNDRVGARLTSSNPVTLTATNNRADTINTKKLSLISGVPKVYRATTTGKFERDFPTDPVLTLKPGAQVMFVKNGKEWANGTIGEVEHLMDDGLTVRLSEGGTVRVTPDKWEKICYSWDSVRQSVGKETIGEFIQIPLRLAWAMTIHKSQGLTLDSAVIDLDRTAFAHGMVYVALSRCRTIEGLSLTRPLSSQDLVMNGEVMEFERRAKLA